MPFVTFKAKRRKILLRNVERSMNFLTKIVLQIRQMGSSCHDGPKNKVPQ